MSHLLRKNAGESAALLVMPLVLFWVLLLIRTLTGGEEYQGHWALSTANYNLKKRLNTVKGVSQSSGGKDNKFIDSPQQGKDEA